MTRAVLLALLFGGLVSAPVTAAPPSAPIVVVTNDAPVHASPDSETIRFHDGLLVVTLRYAYAPMKLIGLDATCNGRRKSFAVQGDDYAYWHNPSGRVSVDLSGRFVEAHFALSLTTQPGKMVRDRYLVMDCDRTSATFGIIE